MSKKIIIFCATVFACIFCAGAASISHAGAARGSPVATGPLDLGYVPGELLVRFAPKPNGVQRNMAERRQILGSLGAASIKKDYSIVPGLSHVKLPAGVTVEQAMGRLNKRNDVIYAQPNHYLMLTGQKFPNDDRFDDLWGMHNTAQDPPGGTDDADIDAPEAWDIETDASAIIVAVIDSGVDYYHEDLAANIWINPGEDQDPLGIITQADWNDEDDDENGLDDDVCGYDFCTSDGGHDSDPKDEYSHGTHVAGTIGAVGIRTGHM